MDSNIVTISVSGPIPTNRSKISFGESQGEARVSSGSLGYSTSVDEAERSTQRKSHWQNMPGIQVTLQSKDQSPQLDEYRQLRSDGRRKDSTKIAPDLTGTENINRTIEVEQLEEGSTNPRSVNPRTKIILDNFIQQMGGAEQYLSSGSYISTSV